MHTVQQLQNGELNGAKYIKISEGLKQFPTELLELADTLEVLDLSGNSLSSLPKQFNKFQKLKTFFCSDNLFEVLPEVLGECAQLDILGFKSNQITTVPANSLNSNLRWLILTNNAITEIPATIGYCLRMQKLMLAGNHLTQLPNELANCKQLGLLRISANLLSSLPDWLLEMPKLAWLAFSGNPFHKIPEVPTLNQIDWKQLELTSVLGEGASGIISKATFENNAHPIEVAIKVFKGAMTSDGLPQDEMNTSIAAGNHPGLVSLLGQIYNHPLHRHGLVMSLIPPSYYNLAGPPSLQSCTRDVFDKTAPLPVVHVIKIAQTIASVAAHLHGQGIMHSDLYAHNILVNSAGDTLFGDFGAACFYNRGNQHVALSLERLEVRAFGYLLEDLLYICDEPGHPAHTVVADLKNACLQEQVSERPSFEWLHQQLFKLSPAIEP
ncbi:MAG: protein kinase [Pedobacter sp.]|nr:MAG: protein kinase [Pedobacter sp.]